MQLLILLIRQVKQFILHCIQEPVSIPYPGKHYVHALLLTEHTEQLTSTQGSQILDPFNPYVFKQEKQLEIVLEQFKQYISVH